MKPDPTTRFFEALGQVGHEPLLRKASGRTVFEIVDGRRVRRWRVAVDKGDVTVETGGGASECVIRADRRIFERVATGRANAVAAVLRGEITVGGDWRLLVAMQRLLAAPQRRRATS